MTIKEFIKSKNVNNHKELYSLYDEFKRETGLKSSKSTYERQCRKYFVKNKGKELLGEVNREVNENGDITSTINSLENFKNVEQMAKYCDIDTKLYKASKIVSNIWGSTDKPMWQFKVWWSPIFKKDEITPYKAAEIFQDLIQNIEIPKSKISNKIKEDGKTVVIGLTDFHTGQLTWGSEIGKPDIKNWDLNIALSELIRVIDFYCNYYSKEKIKKFILPVGSDLFNVNSELGTINGTPQDEDCRSEKTFRNLMSTMVVIIEKLSKIASVDLVYIPGNHDKTISYYLATGLAFTYAKNDKVNVDIAPHDRKYIKVGNTLLGIAHGKVKGKDLKAGDLPQIMADEARELWSQCKYHEWLIGHYHKEKELVSDDFQGCIIRFLPSVTQLSYWTYSSGLKATRQMYVLEYDDISGHIKTVVYRPY